LYSIRKKSIVAWVVNETKLKLTFDRLADILFDLSIVNM